MKYLTYKTIFNALIFDIAHTYFNRINNIIYEQYFHEIMIMLSPEAKPLMNIRQLSFAFRLPG